MSIDLIRPELVELRPRIVVIGIGGAGGNAVNNMVSSGLQGVDFIAANTDAQALSDSLAETRLQLGLKITEGLGAGSRPEIGRAAAEETAENIASLLEGAHMCFITGGMGGGTGTGAAPIIARIAKEKNILTVGVVTKPFAFEAKRRMMVAEEGIEELQNYVDTLIIIPNQNLFRIAGPKTGFKEAFVMADDVLHSGVRSITDLMVMPGLINLDFADVRTVMSEMGKAMMGTGEAENEGRAISAAQAAMSNPLLDEISLKNAKAVLINITGGDDLSLFEVDESVNLIRDSVDPDCNVIFGATFSSDLDGKVRVSVVATGIDESEHSMHDQSADKVATTTQSDTAEASPEQKDDAPVNPFAALAQNRQKGQGRKTQNPEPEEVHEDTSLAQTSQSISSEDEDDILDLGREDALVDRDDQDHDDSASHTPPGASDEVSPEMEHVARMDSDTMQFQADAEEEATDRISDNSTLFERMMGIKPNTVKSSDQDVVSEHKPDDVASASAKSDQDDEIQKDGNQKDGSREDDDRGDESEDPLEIPGFMRRHTYRTNS